MHVTSTLNSDTRSIGVIPVAVFSYEGRRRFVVKSKNYEETVGSVKKEFGIARESEIVLSTISLDVCRGQAVEIGGLAYPHLWDVLDELVISTPENSAPALTPAQTPPAVNQTKGKGRAVSASTLRRPISSARSSHSQGIPSPGSRPYARPSIASPPKAGQKEESEPPASHRTIIPQAILAQIVRDAQEVENALVGGEEDDRDVEEAPSHVRPAKGGPSIDHLFDDDDRVDEAGPGAPVDGAGSPPSSPSPKSKKPRSVAKPAETRISVKKDKVKAEPAKKSKFKPASSKSTIVTAPPRDATPPPPPAPATPPPALLVLTRPEPEQPPIDENTRLAIVIQGPGEDLSAQFKMRGKHPIYKILKTACANFGLDVNRATLWLVLDDEDEDNEEPQCFELPRDQTALQCGIKEGSRLIIQIDEEEGEEEEDEDEYEYGY